MKRNASKLEALREVFSKLKNPPYLLGGHFNPSKRQEIQPDFPRALAPYSGEEALQLITAELSRRSVDIESVDHINIAYPHKHPGIYPAYHNTAEERAYAFRERMVAVAPQIEWVIAEALVERVRLGRSENQTSFHALTGKQEYDIYLKVQHEPLPFAHKDRWREFFVIVDNTIEQGTTIANMMSYIRYNGGDVLMAQGDHRVHIAQHRDVANDMADIGAAFNDVSRNTGRLPELAVAFSYSAKRHGRDWTPKQAIEKFEAAINKYGNSVFALTDGEVQRLIKNVNGTQESFPSLLEKLEKQAPKPKKILQIKQFARL
jgi:hypothetical protein